MGNLKKYLMLIITIPLVMAYLVGTYFLWCRFRHYFPDLKDIITIQIQSTALLIGLIAGTVGLYNFWRKSGVKLLVTIMPRLSTGEYFISIRNLKDKEIIIFKFYLYIEINDQIFAIDILKSSTEYSLESDKNIKAYGNVTITLNIPKAIRLEKSGVERNTVVFQNNLPKDEYVYIDVLYRRGMYDFPKYDNIILAELGGKKALKYLVYTSGGVYRSKTKPITNINITNRLIFCDRKDLLNDYLHNVNKDKCSIDDEELDQFVRDNETTDEALKRSKCLDYSNFQ